MKIPHTGRAINLKSIFMIFYLIWFYIKYLKNVFKPDTVYSRMKISYHHLHLLLVLLLLLTLHLFIQPTEIGMTVNIGFINHFNAVFDKFRYVLGFFGQQTITKIK